MGTTLTCLLASPTNVTIAHVGDTRAYIKRGNRIFQVTRDHLVEDAGAAEEIDERFALFEEEPVMIGRVLGVEPDVEVDIYRLDIEEGDTFLLVSDGVYQYLEEKEIIEIIDSRGPSDSAARELADAAVANGATDNVTAVIWEAIGLEEAVAVPAVTAPAPAPAEERREAPRPRRGGSRPGPLRRFVPGAVRRGLRRLGQHRGPGEADGRGPGARDRRPGRGGSDAGGAGRRGRARGRGGPRRRGGDGSDGRGSRGRGSRS